MEYAEKVLLKADSLVNTRCKIYYPWKQKYIYRVVKKDGEGYYIMYKKEKKRLRIALNDYGDMFCFEVIH